jgi:hypothetical protein
MNNKPSRLFEKFSDLTIIQWYLLPATTFNIDTKTKTILEEKVNIFLVELVEEVNVK